MTAAANPGGAGAPEAAGKPLHALSVREAGQLIASGALGAGDYVEALLAWQSRWGVLNAYAQQDVAAVRAAARALTPGASPLAGVPIAVKDNVDVAGYATTAGTPGLKAHFPKSSAPMVQGLVDRGAIVMGKTGLHEMAAGGTCANIAFGPIRNPYDPGRVPAGSSGGSAAAVAAGLVPAAIGTDTAGSTRAPASYCGCVGFRPTTGRYSRVGLVPGDIRRDTIGWLARSCADVELLDAFSGAPAAPARPVALKGLRLGVPRAYFYEGLEPSLAPIVEAALARLGEAGVELIEADIANVGGRLELLFPLARDLAHDLGVYLAESGAKVSPDEIVHAIADPQLRRMLGGALAQRDLHDEAYVYAKQVAFPALRQAYADYFAGHRLDALIMPTCPEPAYPVPDDVAAGGTGPVSMIRNTVPVAWAGIPGLSIPAGLTAAGLPVGVEFDGPAGSDLTLLRIGQAFEAITPPLPPPPLPA